MLSGDITGIAVGLALGRTEQHVVKSVLLSSAFGGNERVVCVYDVPGAEGVENAGCAASKTGRVFRWFLTRARRGAKRRVTTADRGLADVHQMYHTMASPESSCEIPQSTIYP